MTEVLSSSHVDNLKRYMFDYRFDGSEYSIDIFARTPEEARAKISALTFARLAGEVRAVVPLPSAGLIGRIIKRITKVYRAGG